MKPVNNNKLTEALQRTIVLKNVATRKALGLEVPTLEEAKEQLQTMKNAIKSIEGEEGLKGFRNTIEEGIATQKAIIIAHKLLAPVIEEAEDAKDKAFLGIMNSYITYITELEEVPTLENRMDFIVTILYPIIEVAEMEAIDLEDEITTRIDDLEDAIASKGLTMTEAEGELSDIMDLIEDMYLSISMKEALNDIIKVEFIDREEGLQEALDQLEEDALALYEEMKEEGLINEE